MPRHAPGCFASSPCSASSCLARCALRCAELPLRLYHRIQELLPLGYCVLRREGGDIGVLELERANCRLGLLGCERGRSESLLRRHTSSPEVFEGDLGGLCLVFELAELCASSRRDCRVEILERLLCIAYTLQGVSDCLLRGPCLVLQLHALEQSLRRGHPPGHLGVEGGQRRLGHGAEGVCEGTAHVHQLLPGRRGGLRQRLAHLPHDGGGARQHAAGDRTIV